MSSKKTNLQVVGIGASAGGLKALQELFDNIPADTGMAFVVVQHLSPDFKSLMAELLRKHTKMQIYTAKDKQILKPNTIYLNQKNKNLHIKGSKLYLLDRGPKHNINLPIDIFFHTLGEEYKENAIGIILSGTGSDGSRGIRTIKEEGGGVIVQDPTGAEFDGMPNSAINTNMVHYVLDIESIAQALSKKPTNLLLVDTDSSYPETVDSHLNAVLINIFKFSGIDFREYKKNTLLRRIEKRMNINNVNDLADYALLVSKSDEEKQALKEGFLIGVTRFFRDTEAFADMKNNVIPAICNAKEKGETVRIWVAGSSTGEEVYSLAILFSHYIKSEKLNIDFKIFATDIDPRGLHVASAGVYDINIINELEKQYLDSCFFKTGNRIQIIKSIREKIIFSSHNLINDPPFIKMDLISCRNLLIYLDSNIQKKVLQNFQFSLNMHGYLFLGNSESLGSVAKHFKAINIKWKIFQNTSDYRRYTLHNQPFTGGKLPLRAETNFKILSVPKVINNEEHIYDKYLSRRHSPDSIFIDSNFNILFITGNVGKKLYHREGVFNNNLLKIVSQDVSIILRNGIRRLEQDKKDISIKNVIHETDYSTYSFDLRFHKPRQNKVLKDFYLIEFSEDKIIEAVAEKDTIVLKNIDVDESARQRIEDLEYELKIAKSDLQNAIEKLETTNEELQSSNEELMASNEELQSTNEELQSVNEELYTVNSEMQEKNKELTVLSNDVTNLLDNTEIATIFLDTDLRIRKFTPALKNLFNLNDDDLGRALSSFTSIFDDKTRNKLYSDSKIVLKKLIPVEDQLKDIDGNFYFQRISPFVGANKTIEGVVITIDNINKIKEIENELFEVDLKYHNLFKSLTAGFIHAKIITDENGKGIDWEYLTVNTAYAKMLGTTPKNLIGKRILEILPNLKDDPNNWVESYAITALTGKNQIIEGYVKSINKYIRVNTFSPKKGEFAGTVSDFTELKQKEQALIKNQKELNEAQSISKIGSWTYDIKSGNVTWSKQLFDIYLFDKNRKVPPNYDEHKALYPPESWDRLSKAVELAQTKGLPYELEINMIRANGQLGWLLAIGESVKDENGEIVGLRGSAQDITKQKEKQNRLQNAIKQAEKSELANRHKNLFLANMSHEIRTPMTGVLGFAQLLKNDNLDKKKQLKYIEIIDNNSKQLLNLIDDIIDVSKIETNDIKLVYRGCHVASLMRNLELTYNQIKLIRNKPQLNFVPKIPKKLENLEILTDPLRLEQVICNLLNNALKFSEKGDIVFGFVKDEDYLRFHVKDNGIGIAKNKQKEIFERFKQLNYRETAKYGGTGLGLSICKGIVTVLGGGISVKSKVHEGTTFEFTIPLKKIQQENKKVGLEVSKDFLVNKTVLVAEDDAIIRMLLAAVLKKTGAQVTFANNGKIAVNNFKNNPNVDIVLLDIRMPEMDGIEAMEHMLKINPNAKIIMQTAHAMDEEKAICFKKGCVDFLSKPIIKDELFYTMNKWLN